MVGPGGRALCYPAAMTPPSQPVWHVYGHVVPKGKRMAGCWLTMTIELAHPQEMPYTMYDMPYLVSFDHSPSEEEMEALRDVYDPDPETLPDVRSDAGGARENAGGGERDSEESGAPAA